MYLLYICIGLTLFGAVALLVEKLLNVRSNTLARVRFIALVIALALIIALGWCNVDTDTQVKNLTREYSDIMLYYGTIATCDNEYVRYDFYERIEKYNEQYERHLANSENNWIGLFYSKDWNTLCGPIDSFLAGDYNYNYDYIEGEG